MSTGPSFVPRGSDMGAPMLSEFGQYSEFTARRVSQAPVPANYVTARQIHSSGP